MARARSTANALKGLLSTSDLPIYALDAQRRILFCNESLQKWVGLAEQSLVGRRCDYHSVPRPDPEDSVAAGLCPPPDVFTGQRVRGEVSCRTPGGALERRPADFVPLSPPGVDGTGVLVIVDSSVSLEQYPSRAPDEPTPSELHRTLRSLREELSGRYRVDQLIGESPLIQRVRAQVRLVGQSRSHAVVWGPPGSGLEHVARTIHYGTGADGAEPLLPLACSLFDAELLQSTITAFVRRAVQGDARRMSTVLLLDVDQLPADAQHELLGLLSLPQFAMRAIATSRRPLVPLAKKGRFLPDLALALSTLVIEIPPLRARPLDIPLLAQYFLELVNSERNRQLSGFSPEALDELAAHPWPKNMEELAEVVQQACRRAEGPYVALTDLPDQCRRAITATARPKPVVEEIVLDEFLAEVETELLRRALLEAKGNKARAARLLGISRARLHRRLEQLKLRE